MRKAAIDLFKLSRLIFRHGPRQVGEIGFLQFGFIKMKRLSEDSFYRLIQAGVVATGSFTYSLARNK